MRINLAWLQVLGVVLILSGCSLDNFSVTTQPDANVMKNQPAKSVANADSVTTPKTIRIATFNASMDASNYVARGEKPVGNELVSRLARDDEPQIKNVAEIIQRVRPDVLLINEFDYIANPAEGVENFLKHYLQKPQANQKAMDYPYYFVAPVNTGVPVPYSGKPGQNDPQVYGFGHYPGQYGMVILSRFPLVTEQIRTFQAFLWKDMPDNLLSTISDQEGKPWYSDNAQSQLRLSSKSHWDVPIRVGEKVIHVLASHPTPPVFDGPEDRNGKRNHDEVRFWTDYLNGERYFYDDHGNRGGFTGNTFVVMGDLNASPVEGDAHNDAIRSLVEHHLVDGDFIPVSDGGKMSRENNPHAASHTAGWGMRADYVLPSKAGWEVKAGEVFWPVKSDSAYRLIEKRSASSDHRLVWVDLTMLYE